MIRLIQIQGGKVSRLREPMERRMNVWEGDRLYPNALIQNPEIHDSTVTPADLGTKNIGLE
jgi:hypothetical protein